MGFHISWIGIRGKAPEAVRSELGLVETGARQEIPEADILGLSLESGWYIVFFNSLGSPEIESKLWNFSTGAELIACLVEEGSMVSQATGFADGESIWSVLHNSAKGLTHLREQGALPAAYDAIREAQLARQAQTTKHVDYVFDVPVRLAEAITGYRHDRFFGKAGEKPYVVLARA